MGFIFAALLAGYSPNTTPIRKQKATARPTTPMFREKVIPALDHEPTIVEL